MRQIYLCGGINGLTDADAKDWRERAKKELDGWRCLDPMARDYRGKEITNCKAIVEDDLRDIDECCALLVKADRPSWGTAMEIFYAHRAGKTIVLWGVDPNKLSPWLLYHSHYQFETLDQAIAKLERDNDPMYGPPRANTWK